MDARTAERVYNSVEFRERAALGVLVTITGGCMDGYSYLTQGKVFATGQTGNCVLLIVRLSELDFPGVAHYLAPILSFLAGVLLSKWSEDHILKRNHFSMQRAVLVAQAVVFLVLSLLPDEIPDLLVNSVISCLAAFTFENFRKFGRTSNYTPTFNTGNMRSFAETLYEGVAHHNAHQRHRSLSYLTIVGAFLLGVLLIAMGSRYMGAACGWIVSVLSLVALRFVTDIATELEKTRRRVEAEIGLEDEVDEILEHAADEMAMNEILQETVEEHDHTDV